MLCTVGERRGGREDRIQDPLQSKPLCTTHASTIHVVVIVVVVVVA